MKSRQSPKPSLSSFEQAQIYLHLLEQRMRKQESEEKQSEQRVIFFLGIASVLAGFFTLLFQKGVSINEHGYAISLSLLVLSIYGWLTFPRVIWRNQAVELLDLEIHDLLDSIEALDPSVALYLNRSWHRDKKKRCWLIQHLNGSFTQYLYFSEALITGIFAYVLSVTLSLPLSWVIIIPVLVSLSVPIALYMWSQTVRDIGKESSASA